MVYTRAGAGIMPQQNQQMSYTPESLGLDSSIVVIPPFSGHYKNILVPERFSDRIVSHVLSQYLSGNHFFCPPMFLAIEGAPGEGKTSQTIASLSQKGILVLYVSATNFSGAHEAESKKVFEKFYTAAVNLRKSGHVVALVVDDFHKSIANEDKRVTRTVNTDLLTGYMMNITENNGELKVPIILTANDFSKVYAPLLRNGRADIYPWQPDYDEKKQIIAQLFNGFVINFSDNLFDRFFDEFKDENIAFFVQLKNRHRLGTITEYMKQFARFGTGEIYQLDEIVKQQIAQVSLKELKTTAKAQIAERSGKK